MSGVRAPDLSETTWLGATLAVGGFIFGVVGVLALLWTEPLILAGVAIGTSITISVVLGAIIGSQRKNLAVQRTHIVELETELKDTRGQAAEWSATSNNISLAVRSVLELMGTAPTTAPPRVPRRKDEPEEPAGDA